MITFNVPDMVIRQSVMVCDRTNFGKRGVDDGTKEQQLHGIIAQNCMALAFGFPFVKPSDTWDGGFDFRISDQKIDIKSVTRTVQAKPEYECFVVTEQLRYDVQVYLFTSYNKRANQLTICGWLPKDIFMQRSRAIKRGDVIQRDDGTSFVCRLEARHIYYYQLNGIATSLEELREDLELFALWG